MSITEDVKYLRRWAAAHDERHTTDDDRLNIILEAQQKHDTNHHGTKSRIKESSLTILFFGAIAALGELVGLWELFSRLPLF